MKKLLLYVVLALASTNAFGWIHTFKLPSKFQKVDGEAVITLNLSAQKPQVKRVTLGKYAPREVTFDTYGWCANSAILEMEDGEFAGERVEIGIPMSMNHCSDKDYKIQEWSNSLEQRKKDGAPIGKGSEGKLGIEVTQAASGN